MNDNPFKSKLIGFWQIVKKIAKRVWAYLKIAKMEYIVMASVFAVDLISKAIVNATVKLHETVVLIPKFLNIHNIHNYNAAFGADWLTNALGNMGARILFCIFAVAASVAFIIILIKCRGGSKILRLSLALVTAGALGNCVDRMFLGYVRDFIEFVYFGLTIFGSKSFYIFNIADAALVIGVILMVVYFIFFYREKDDDKKHAAASTVSANGEVKEEQSELSEQNEQTETSEQGEQEAAPEQNEQTDAPEQGEQTKDERPEAAETTEQTDDIEQIESKTQEGGTE